MTQAARCCHRLVVMRPFTSTLWLAVSLIGAASLAASGCGSGGSGTTSTAPGASSQEAGAGAGFGDATFAIGDGASGTGGEGGSGGRVDFGSARRAGERHARRECRLAGDAALQGHGRARRRADRRSTSRAASSSRCPTTTSSATSPRTAGRLSRRGSPCAPTDPPQQGGTLTVEAEALNPGNAPSRPRRSLTVQLVAALDTRATARRSAVDAGAPAESEPLFGGPSDPTRAPVLEYPNDGTMLPPNLRLLDVHWMPGSASNTLYQSHLHERGREHHLLHALRHRSAMLLVAGACGFQLDATGYGYLAQSNAGQGNVALTDPGDRRHRHVGRNVDDDQHPVRAEDGERRRLLLGRHRHAHHALRLRRHARRRPTSSSPRATTGRRHVHRLPRPLARTGPRSRRRTADRATGAIELHRERPTPAHAATTPLLTQTEDTTTASSSRRSIRSGDQFVAVYGDTDAPARSQTPVDARSQQAVVPRRHDRDRHRRREKVLYASSPTIPAGRPTGR